LEYGKDNNFGHPSNFTLQNLKKINSKIYRTDELGEIGIIVNKKGYLAPIRKALLCHSD